MIATRPPAPNSAHKAGDEIADCKLIKPIAIRKTTTIAKPPPLGVGSVCELLALGISSKLRVNAYKRITAVIVKDAATAARNHQKLMLGQTPDIAAINALDSRVND